MDLYALYNDNLIGEWETGPNDVQYRVVKQESTSQVRFQGTISAIDWKVDFEFFVKPYKRMKNLWFAHSGFLRGYKGVRDAIMDQIKDSDTITISGYSLGAAYSQLLHEDIKFNYPDKKVITILYGAPRVFWFPSKVIKERCKDIIRVSNYGDIVTHSPPPFFGYGHIGKKVPIGNSSLFFTKIFPITSPLGIPFIRDHQPISYLQLLKDYKDLS